MTLLRGCESEKNKKGSGLAAGMLVYSEEITIDQILANEGFILTDLSAQHAFMNDGLTQRVKIAFDYLDLQSAKFDETLKGLAKFNRFMCSPNVYTTPKVVEEVKAWEALARRALKRLDKNKDATGRSKHVSHTSQGINQIKQNVDAFYHSVRRLRESAANALIGKSSANSDYRQDYVNTLHYVAMEMMVIAVSDIADSKNDFEKHYKAWAEGRYDLHTDEQLVATALCVSVVLKKPVAILTGDSDIWHITGDVLNAVARAGVPGVYTILNAVSENPVRIYFSGKDGQIEKKADTSGLVMHMKTMAESLRNEKEELTQAVTTGLEEFFAA